MQTKFLVVLGSLMSGLGKGIVTGSILKMLDFYDYKALPVKFDGYLNYDCGTMNPYRHGEVFVFDDKSEVDMDFGMYERFSGNNMTKDQSLTGGKLFSEIITKERRGDYLGRDVQIIPQLTDLIIERLVSLAEKKKPDVLVIEVGGTVGDIENGYFIEAMRQLSLKYKTVFVDVTYIPKLSTVGEQKTKPTQLAYRAMMQEGIKPDFVVCRGEERLEENTKKKLALFTSLSEERIIDDITLPTLYQVPLYFMEQNFDKLLMADLGLKVREKNRKKLTEWKSSVERIIHPKKQVEVALVGKYTKLRDAYISVKEALIHAGSKLDTRVNIRWIEAEELESKSASDVLKGVSGIIVPIGWGKRGTEGKINAITYARENKIPYLGLCLGLQLMVIEYARNVCGLNGATSSEFDEKAKYDVIDLLPEQIKVREKGATMRLGAWEAKVTSHDTILYRSYKKDLISERHRHRWEVNNKYRPILEKNGLVISGTTTDGKIVEFVEWKDSFGIGTQAHPEYKSRLQQPAPLFVSFIEAANELAEERPKKS